MTLQLFGCTLIRVPSQGIMRLLGIQQVFVREPRWQPIDNDQRWPELVGRLVVLTNHVVFPTSLQPHPQDDDSSPVYRGMRAVGRVYRMSTPENMCQLDQGVTGYVASPPIVALEDRAGLPINFGINGISNVVYVPREKLDVAAL